jgi:hypothetical protein
MLRLNIVKVEHLTKERPCGIKIFEVPLNQRGLHPEGGLLTMAGVAAFLYFFLIPYHLPIFYFQTFAITSFPGSRQLKNYINF